MGDLLMLPTADRTSVGPMAGPAQHDPTDPAATQTTTIKCPACQVQMALSYESADDYWEQVAEKFRFFRQAHARCGDVWSRLD